MQLHVRAFGLSFGIVMGLGILLMTLISLWFGRGQTIDALVVPFPGYGRSILGALMGFVWGFIDGFIGGALLAWLYNRFSSKKASVSS